MTFRHMKGITKPAVASLGSLFPVTDNQLNLCINAELPAHPGLNIASPTQLGTNRMLLLLLVPETRLL